MKKLLLIIGLLFVFTLVRSQDSMFQKEDKLLNLGVGLRAFHPALSASLDYCIADDIIEDGSIGVGPYAGIELGSSYLAVAGGVRGTFHYPIIEDLDTYAGAGLGFRYKLTGFTSFHIIPAFFIGANYPVTDKIVAFGELGSGTSYLTIGITILL